MATILNVDKLLSIIKQTNEKEIPFKLHLDYCSQDKYQYIEKILNIKVICGYDFYIVHNSYKDICKVIQYLSKDVNKLDFRNTCIYHNNFIFVFTKEDCEQICKNFTKSFKEKHNL